MTNNAHSFATICQLISLDSEY